MIKLVSISIVVLSLISSVCFKSVEKHESVEASTDKTKEIF